jgi:hypothetical protein
LHDEGLDLFCWFLVSGMLVQNTVLIWELKTGCPIKQALQWHTLVIIKYQILFLELMILFLSQALDMCNEFNVALGLMLEIGGRLPSKKYIFENFWTVLEL